MTHDAQRATPGRDGMASGRLWVIGRGHRSSVQR